MPIQMRSILNQPFTTILLIGEGFLVKQLGRRLLRKENSVWALVSSETLAPGMSKLGLNPVVADPTDPDQTQIAVANVDVIYHLAARRSHGAPSPEPGDLKGLQTILSLLPPKSVRRYIYESALAVYDGLAGEGIDETARCKPKSAVGRICLEGERELLARFSEERFPVIVFRSGALYQPTPGIYEQVRKGAYTLPPDLPPLLHRIYIEDYLDILVAAMEKGEPGRIYNLVDQEPHPSADYFAFMAATWGAPPPPGAASQSDSAPRVRFQNKKLLEAFGALRFPTFREGLRDAIQKAGAGASSPS